MSSKNNKKTKKRPILKYLLGVTLFVVFLGLVISIATYLHFSRGLPDLKDLTGYKPNLINEIYSSDGTLIAEYGIEKRKLIDLEEIPDHVVDAFIAIEDKRFYEHSGLDIQGITRALIQNIREGQVVSGGSTITQQVTKNLILTPEKTYTRKIKEAILSYRIEKNLSKKEILYLYLNHIYLADGTYGVEAASKNYFGKSVRDINIAEASLLAGIPKRPERYSPRRNFTNSKKRQQTVLKIMEDEGFITPKQKTFAEEYNLDIKPKNSVESQIAPYFTEFIRKYLEEKVGTEEYKLGGYKVFTTLDTELSLAAQWAIRNGINDFEKRWGRGFILNNLRTERAINKFKNSQKGLEIENEGIYKAVVTGIESKNKKMKTATLEFGDKKESINFYTSKPFGTIYEKINFKYSDKYAPITTYNGIEILPDDLKVGDIIKIKVLYSNNKIKIFPIYDTKTQAALISLDTNGNVLTMIGGYDFNQSQFNRSVQAKRQPGSSFKPLLYSAALDKGYTETSILYDIPVVIDDWEPSNYDDKYSGAVVLRKALARSRNLASIRLILDIGPEYVSDYSKNFGFDSTLNPFPSLALGGSDVTLFEMVAAYNVFASKGIYREPRFILRIYDRNGTIIEDNTGQTYIKYEKVLKQERENKRIEILKQLAQKKGLDSVKKEDTEKTENKAKTPEENNIDQNFLDPLEFLALMKKVPIKYFQDIENDIEAISPDTAYIVTDLLKAVISEGTGIRAAKLNAIASVAGKTGTTNDYTDAWFLGYSPEVVTGVWVGRDNHTSLGKKESGSRAALPIWANFMEDAIKKYNKEPKFEKPTGVRYVETPYGYIPYKVESLRDNVIKVLRSRNLEPDGLKKKDIRDVEFENDESEIDFLLRR